jgi:hypothetical protein
LKHAAWIDPDEEALKILLAVDLKQRTGSHPELGQEIDGRALGRWRDQGRVGSLPIGSQQRYGPASA